MWDFFDATIWIAAVRQRIAPESVVSLRQIKVGVDKRDRAYPGLAKRTPLMHEMMSGGMMWGMGFWGLVLLVLVLVAIAALVKYVFFR